MHMAPGDWMIESIGVISVSPKQWRVSDLEKREADGLALLGFIQQIDEVFEVTMLGLPRQRFYKGTFSEAVEMLAAKAELDRKERKTTGADQAPTAA